MSNWNVLIVDDEAAVSKSASSRYQRYLRLEREEYDGKRFNLVFAKSGEESRTELRRGRFDVVLLDVRLSRWGDDKHGTLFKEFLELANRRFTVGLVSSNWDTTSMQLVRDFLISKPQIRVPLFFTFRDFADKAFAAIATQIVTHLRRQRSLHKLELSPNAPLRLLHISDLHFGSEYSEQTLAGIANTKLICDKIKGEWPESTDDGPAGPHIIAVTGDIGNSGHPCDYDKALTWFRSFAHQFGWSLPSPRILLVPGNHDFSVALCGAQRIGLKMSKGSKKNKILSLLGPAKRNERLGSYSMRPFSDFASQVSTIAATWEASPLASWVELGFEEYGVAFSGFNTSKFGDKDSWPLRNIDLEDIVRVKGKFEDVLHDIDNVFHIALSHHSLVKYNGVREEISNSDECAEHFLKTSFPPNLLLHGHEHRRWGELPSGNDFMIVAAPTPTVGSSGRPTDSSRGVNLIALGRVASVVKNVRVTSLVKAEGGWSVALPLPNKHQFDRT